MRQMPADVGFRCCYFSQIAEGSADERRNRKAKPARKRKATA